MTTESFIPGILPQPPAPRAGRLTARGILTLEALRWRCEADPTDTYALELRFRDRLPSYLGRSLRRATVLQPADLLARVEPSLESAEVDDFLRTDVLAQGTVNGEQGVRGGADGVLIDERP